MTKITNVKCIRTRKHANWTIVKVETDQPGLYGIGSASDNYNPNAVTTVIEELLAPQLVGRDPGPIEDLWQSMYASGYWRNGPLVNTAISGIDMALWDIKGKEAGMPTYKLLGGPCRSAAPCYAHASGRDFQELEEDVQRYIDEGYQVIRCQLGQYGGGGFVGAGRAHIPDPGLAVGSKVQSSDRSAHFFDDEFYLENIPQMFDRLRTKFGMGVKFTHDVHEHLTPTAAVTLAKLLEPYRLFFLEDLLPPEQIDWYRQVRQQCSTPQAIGELFVNPREWIPLIKEQLIDFIRVRVSKVGGISACRKIAALSEAFGVRTAWQEGGDNDPVNQMASLHLDLAVWNFGIQEENHFAPEELEVFPGHAILKGGYLYPGDGVGLGIDIDETKAATLMDPDLKVRRYFNPYPIDTKADGTVVRP